MCQDADLFTKPLDIHKFYKHAKTVLNVVRCDLNVGVYYKRYKLSYGKYQFLISVSELGE